MTMRNAIIAPGYMEKRSLAPGNFRTAELLPMYEASVIAAGTKLEFAATDETRELAVPIPRLAGMDDIELDRVSFDLAGDSRTESVSVPGSPVDGETALALTGPAAAASRLERIEIDELRITASAGASFALEGGGGLSRVLYGWDAGHSTTTVVPNGSDPAARQVHLMVRPAAGSGFGPPAAAFPNFAMPGAGGALYGPALGGAAMTLSDEGSGKIKAVLRLDPPLPGSRFALLVGHADQATPNGGLPNEVEAVTWSAANIGAFFDVRPVNLRVTASVPADPAELAVAEVPTDPGDRPVNVDFSGVARTLLRKSHSGGSGPDLGLKLLFRSGAPGAIRVNLAGVQARYLIRPLEHGPAAVKLLGAPESIEMAVSAVSKPSAISFTLDGAFGPARLTLDSDTEAPDARQGLRAGGGVVVARRIALTAAEANLPIVRLGLFGRTREPSELLLTLHRGDAARIGPAVADPLSLEIEPSAAPAWHRKEFAAPGLLPPHPGALWLALRTTRGDFWWHGALNADGFAQRSADGGSTFTQVCGRPGVHVSVEEVRKEGDPPVDIPSPVQPVSLLWRGGLLNADVVGVAGIEASLPREFRRFWIAEGAAHQSFLGAVPSLEGTLRLTFTCRRDVDLAVSDAVLTYDPWNA